MFIIFEDRPSDSQNERKLVEVDAKPIAYGSKSSGGDDLGGKLLLDTPPALAAPFLTKTIFLAIAASARATSAPLSRRSLKLGDRLVPEDRAERLQRRSVAPTFAAH